MNDIQEYCRKIYGETYTELIGNEPEAFAQKEAIRAALTETMREFQDADTIAREISNAPRDISWLKEQVHSGVFDLYAVVSIDDGRKFCYGCIQSKTSIRDRVTRDREPSLQAMRSFFWSVIIVLDGDFLRLPKFIAMVNGGTVEYPCNGWHGMYVFSEKFTGGRIYPVSLDFGIFREHAITAAKYWLSQRQWFNESWRADNS